MKKHFLLLLFLGSLFSLKAQEVKVDFSYKYLYSKQWDKAIQTYNFSRPFLNEKQPLLMNGFNSSISYLFKSNKSYSQGLNLSYSYFRSLAENSNYTRTLNLHFINLGYVFHLENKEKKSKLFYEILISATSSGLFRKINDQPTYNEDKKLKALGIGGDVNFKIGYYLKLKNNYYISPFISIGYTPYLYSPNSETMLNDTKGLVTKNATGIVSSQIGVSFNFRKMNDEN